MNKEQLEGYLLACCDSIDRLIETGKLKEDDLAGKLAENLREYIRLNQNVGWIWWHIDKYPLYSGTSSIKFCPLCNQQIKDGEIHICYSNTSTTGNTK